MSEEAEGPRGARIAVDLGAESCRVSLLRWHGGRAEMTLVHRFPHGPVARGGCLCWDLEAIEAGVEEGLERAAAMAPEGVTSIGVDGWAVDYVRLDAEGRAIAAPFCYRDPRAAEGAALLHAVIAPERLYSLSGVQVQPLNTVYQQHMDWREGREGRWLNLPEYLLFRWGGAPVAEFTNATHTGMLGLDGQWCGEIFRAAGLRMEDAPRVVVPGTDLGEYRGPVKALLGARLIAPCCHDTASAVAGIGDAGEDWAYISSGTWSLIGTVVDQACVGAESIAENFTNLGAAGGRVLLHKGVPGMWLLQQCLRQWGTSDVSTVVAEAGEEKVFGEGELLDLVDARLQQPGNMPALLNLQRAERGLRRLERRGEMARLIFDSLAREYARVLGVLGRLSGKKFRRVWVVGGGSQNELLNRLTAEACGLEVRRGLVESSTVGNLAVQMASAAGDSSAAGVRRALAEVD